MKRLLLCRQDSHDAGQSSGRGHFLGQAASVERTRRSRGISFSHGHRSAPRCSAFRRSDRHAEQSRSGALFLKW
ncbi:MAG: hypothetical protein SAMD01599839_09240 [Rectinema sp.]